MSQNAPSQKTLLDDYFSQEEMAKQLDRSTRALRLWRVERRGPPVTAIGRTQFYLKASAVKWLRDQERA